MAGLCPKCGALLCDHKPREQGFVKNITEADEIHQHRKLTEEEKAAFAHGDQKSRIAAARKAAKKIHGDDWEEPKNE